MSQGFTPNNTKRTNRTVLKRPQLTAGLLKMPDMKLQDMKIQDMNLQDMTNIV